MENQGQKAVKASTTMKESWGVPSNEWAGGRILRIPSSHVERDVNQLPLSTRARNVLIAMGVQVLGKLDGVSTEKILDARNCGLKTYEEILRSLESLGDSRANNIQTKEIASLANRCVMTIPLEARDWPIGLLPFSVRLCHALQKLKCARLGDLDGLSYSVLLEMPDCGAITVSELRGFLERLHRGEFEAPQERTGKTAAVFLVSKIDGFVAGLSAPQKEIFMDRLGAADRPMTLAQVGEKFQITRERVRQVVSLLTDGALRFGGPPFVRCLEDLTTECNRHVCPLTSALLAGLLGAPQQQARHAFSFYIRLLGWLSPKLSAWPVGQTPAAYRAVPHETILTRLKRWFEAKNAAVTTAEAYGGVCSAEFSCSPFAFLDALRFGAEFAIHFDDPQRPMISPPVAAPRRWARQLLATSASSSLPPETMARAKALLQSRRAPALRYRLAIARSG